MNWCYLLIDLDANGTFGDVPDLTRAAVVELVGHTLVDCAVHFYVDVVTDLEGPQVGREGDVPLLPEGPSEQVSGPRTKTMTSRHLRSLSLELQEGEDMEVAAKTLGGSVFGAFYSWCS